MTRPTCGSVVNAPSSSAGVARMNVAPTAGGARLDQPPTRHRTTLRTPTFKSSGEHRAAAPAPRHRPHRRPPRLWRGPCGARGRGSSRPLVAGWGCSARPFRGPRSVHRTRTSRHERDFNAGSGSLGGDACRRDCDTPDLAGNRRWHPHRSRAFACVRQRCPRTVCGSPTGSTCSRPAGESTPMPDREPTALDSRHIRRSGRSRRRRTCTRTRGSPVGVTVAGPPVGGAPAVAGRRLHGRRRRRHQLPSGIPCETGFWDMVAGSGGCPTTAAGSSAGVPRAGDLLPGLRRGTRGASGCLRGQAPRAPLSPPVGEDSGENAARR